MVSRSEEMVVVVGLRLGRERASCGLRADLREMVTVGAEGRLPGAGMDCDEEVGSREEFRVGGSGCGGWESLGRVYCSAV